MTRLVLSGLAMGLLALPSLAQSTNAPPTTIACGTSAGEFHIKTKPGLHPAQAEAGKALLYFIEKDEDTLIAPTTRVGLDGAWVGGTRGDSYFFFSVAPGVHHLCAMTDAETVLAHFTAKEGEVYYFLVKNIVINRGTWTSSNDVTFGPLDSDEGQMLVDRDEYATTKVH